MLTLLLSLLIAQFLIESLADILNLGRLSAPLPADLGREFEGFFDQERYAKMVNYQTDRTRFSLLKETMELAFLIAFILLGGFQWVDQTALRISDSVFIEALVFAGVYSLVRFAVQLPFSLYSTFVIEERYGFNRTTLATFVIDLIKGGVLGSILGGGIFLGVVFFFEKQGREGWVYAWIGLTFFQVLLQFLAPAVLMPLFNKFTPLQAGELEKNIEEYVHKEKFPLQGVFTMNGSKRSTKANAFFTGFGKFRRLVLFDTLVEKQTPEELTAVVAHEIGHFRCGHIVRSMAASIVMSGLLLFVLSRFLNEPSLFQAFGVTHLSTYASLIFLSILFGPFGLLFSLLTHFISRKYEFEADAFSLQTYGKKEALISALKKLSADSLSHLNPHPLKVALAYTHPPMAQRIAALRR